MSFWQKAPGVNGFKQLSISLREKKAISTSPKWSEFHKKLDNLPQRHFGARKKRNSYFVL